MFSSDPSKTGEENLTEGEVRAVEQRVRLRAPVVYQIVREEGEIELARPLGSLWWSGLAAGIAISMSLVTQAILRQHLPDAPWRGLVDSLGYSVGFIIVTLGRLQLFTENTITAVLPLMAARTRRNLYLTARLWGVVFLANMAGTLIFAAAATYAGIFAAEHLDAFRAVALALMEKSPGAMLLQGIPAGFLIAAMVWMIPSAEGADFWVILLTTYLIALCNLTHVVAGSAEAFLLLVAGDIGLGRALGGFLLPVLIGNIIGGTALFTVLAYGQVKDEL